MEKEFLTSNKEETKAVGKMVAKNLSGGEIITFFGDLGAGKTAFVEGLTSGLSINAEVTSPTFSLVNEYRGDKTLYHFDMYRIGSEEELYSIGFYDYLNEEAIIAIEWAENVIDFLPESDITVKIEKLGDNERKITVKGAAIFENSCS